MRYSGKGKQRDCPRVNTRGLGLAGELELLHEIQVVRKFGTVFFVGSGVLNASLFSDYDTKGGGRHGNRVPMAGTIHVLTNVKFRISTSVTL